MGRSKNSGLGNGIGLGNQLSISQSNFDIKINKLSKKPKPFNSNDFSFNDSKSKYEGYLLNIGHKDGKSKAKFLNDVLGYNIGDAQALHNAISEALNGKLPDKIEQTKFGTKYIFQTKIRGKDGSFKPANVVVVVQNDKGKTTWRIITLYPRKKD